MAHPDHIVTDLQMSADKTYCITSSKDKTSKVSAVWLRARGLGCRVLCGQGCDRLVACAQQRMVLSGPRRAHWRGCGTAVGLRLDEPMLLLGAAHYQPSALFFADTSARAAHRHKIALDSQDVHYRHASEQRRHPPDAAIRHHRRRPGCHERHDDVGTAGPLRGALLAQGVRGGVLCVLLPRFALSRAAADLFCVQRRSANISAPSTPSSCTPAASALPAAARMATVSGARSRVGAALDLTPSASPRQLV